MRIKNTQMLVFTFMIVAAFAAGCANGGETAACRLRRIAKRRQLLSTSNPKHWAVLFS